MNHRFRRASSLLLTFALALSLLVPALAAELTAHTVTTRLGEGLTLTQYNSLQGGQRRQQFSLDYVPGGSVRPVVLYGEELYGKSPITAVLDYAEARGMHVLAAVNSDYFSMTTGVPTGMTVQDGRLVSSDGGWNAVAFFRDGTAMIGKPDLTITLTDGRGDKMPVYSLNKVRTGDGVYLYTPDFDKTTRTTASGTEVVLETRDELRLGRRLRAEVVSVEHASGTPILPGQMVLSLTDANKAGLSLSHLRPGDRITIEAETRDKAWEKAEWCSGGGNILVRDGVITADAKASGREPRTLLGTREDGSVHIIECDGRQSAVSSGLSLAEGAQLMLDQGCTQVINLDGGGSSVFAASLPGLRSEVLSSPSDGSPRASATFIAFLAEGSRQGRSYGSVVYPRSATVLAGASLPVQAFSYNRDFLGFLDVTDRIEASDGFVSDGLFIAPAYAGTVTLSTGDRQCQDSRLTVVETIPQLHLGKDGKAISALTIERRASFPLEILASDGVRPVLCSPEQFTFTVEGNLGTISPEGVFTAGSLTGSGSITVTAGRNSVTIPLTVVGRPPRVITGFEQENELTPGGSATASVSAIRDLALVRYGKGSALLSAGEPAQFAFAQPPVIGDASHLTLSARGSGDWYWVLQLPDGTVDYSPFALSGSDDWQTVTAAVPDGAKLAGFACTGAGKASVTVDQLIAHYGAVSLDAVPPYIQIESTEGALSALISDNNEVGLEKSNITVTVDGDPVPFTYQNDRLTAALPTDGGLHRITVVARDSAGNLSRAGADIGTLTTTFRDMENHWAAPQAEFLLRKGVFSPSETFSPADKVSNEMAATLLSRYLGVDVNLYADVVLPYRDADRISSWALPHVRAMYALGIMRGSVDANKQSVLKPQASCSRAQIMTILGRTMERGYSYEPCRFADAGKIGSWARDHIDLLSALGIITGDDAGRVNPNGTLTRAEFASLLYRLY